ncbi:hypothetical protein QYM36_019217 [Artemia franciscana]|uniref:Uncharacterized protein n=1 Tax=Artemia franciscana TaxID=6661 RepID=A0AA88H5J8_ARTSF|nr:hypothetical protein QYM36_019217 [Artemia franciscana]
MYFIVMTFSVMAVSASPEFLSHPKTSIFTLVEAVTARATTTSEILTLNLSNLLMLGILKIIVLVFGIVGAGRRRSNVNLSFGIDELVPDVRDASLIMSMSLAEKTGERGCFYRLACEDYERAKDYLGGAKIVLARITHVKR